MSKLLIAVKSCAGDVASGANQAIRDTWARGDDVKFFVGKSSIPLLDDEISLPCPDGYFSLPAKTREILKWALEQGNDFIFLCDTDTWVNLPKMLACGFEQYDITAWFAQPTAKLGTPRAREGYYDWPSGGAGYWLSARAAKIITGVKPSQTEWAEDRLVGQILGPYLERRQLTGYNCPGFDVEDGITKHFCARGMHRDYDPKWMHEMHKKWGRR